MKRILLSGFAAGAILLGLSYFILFFTIRFMPGMVEEYYNPVFWPGNERALLFFLHPFVISFALAWFWNRFKNHFPGTRVARGARFAVVYVLIATLPSMWITFSAIAVSLSMVLAWAAYGFLQVLVAGWAFAFLNP